MGRTPLADGPSADSFGTSQRQSFAFLLSAASTCARSLRLPGTCDLPNLTAESPRSMPRLPLIGTTPPSRPLNRLFATRGSERHIVPGGVRSNRMSPLIRLQACFNA